MDKNSQSHKTYISLTALEDKLKAQLRLKTPDEATVKPIRHQLQQEYLRMIVCDCELAARIGVEVNLWKLCHYKKIDEYRRAQAKGQSQLEDPAKSSAAEQVLVATTNRFGRFLDQSTNRYMALLQKSALACSLVLPGYGRAPDATWPCGLDMEVHASSNAKREAMVATCYRSLIYLGDLERYRGTCLRDMTTYDWTTAERHYRTALLLRPHAGNPHNQRGVIANYHNNDLDGLYHYSRSILCNEPYLPQGRANLEMTLRRNRDTVLEDAMMNSQQRRRIPQDHALGSLVFGRWFVRPLALLSLLSNIELVVLAEEDALSRLTEILDTDRYPSELCLRMACACVFTVSDLERQLREANERMDGGDENQGGNKPPDLALVREAFQHALEYTFRVALALMRSAKATHHHLQAVGVMCVWLMQNPYLIAPQKDINSVWYDCDRLRRSQESFVEGLVDLLNLLGPHNTLNPFTDTHKSTNTVAAFDVLAGGIALPEDVLLVGWTPFRGGLDFQGVLVGMKVEESTGEMLKRRLERVTSLAMLLSQPPGPLLCFNASTKELSVERLAGRRVRSRQAAQCTETVPWQQTSADVSIRQHASAYVSITEAAASPQPLPPKGKSNGFAVPAQVPQFELAGEKRIKRSDQNEAVNSRDSALFGSFASTCAECSRAGQAGTVDEFDGLFYCDDCWANLEAPDAENHAPEITAGLGPLDGPLDMHEAVENGDAAINDGLVLSNQAEEDRWGEDDDEAFGSGSLAVGGGELASGLESLAQQTALFAAAAADPYRRSSDDEQQQRQHRLQSDSCGYAAHYSLEAPRSACARDRPQGSQHAEYSFLEQLVQRTVGGDGDCEHMNDCRSLECKRAVDGDDDVHEEEEIVFKPRAKCTNGMHAGRTSDEPNREGTATHSDPLHSSHTGRAPQEPCLPTFSRPNAAAYPCPAAISSVDTRIDSDTTMDLLQNSGSPLFPADSSLWGGFGKGFGSFGAPGASDSRAVGGGILFQTPLWSDAEWGRGSSEGNQGTHSSEVVTRFATRNPFAN
jgi:hypothetical protein